jgi:hypothetical protein
LLSRIETAASCPIKVEVDWTSLQTEGYGSVYADAWPQVFFEPLIGALESITIDEMGREALAHQLKTIRICDSGNHGVTFSSNELTVNYDAVANLADSAVRPKEIYSVLESHL